MTSYEVYNAMIQNGWTVAEAAREFGISQDEVRTRVDIAGGRIVGRGGAGVAR